MHFVFSSAVPLAASKRASETAFYFLLDISCSIVVGQLVALLVALLVVKRPTD